MSAVFYAHIFVGFFVITKGVNMQKVSYMGDGSTTEFSFNFPYFENTNIVVTKNGTTATGYSVIGTSAGEDADIPYTGGKVVFETAPTSLDNIIIARSLPLTRVADYQPTAKIEPTTLNQDMNYMMEVLKDLQDEIETLYSQYEDIADKDSTVTLLAKIAAIHDEIIDVSAQITALGDVSQIRENITTLNTRTTGLLDYVITSQEPTADNNYTWYRKYKSGWVEQGGVIDKSSNVRDTSASVTLPIEMANIFYAISINGYNTNTGPTSQAVGSSHRLTTGFFAYCVGFTTNDTARYLVWQVNGMAA